MEKSNYNASLKPFIKWAGGKSSEIDIITSKMPETIHNYVEPFLGGGALYFGLSKAEITGTRYANDYSDELMQIYSAIKNRDTAFFSELDSMKNNWDMLTKFANDNADAFKGMFRKNINCYDTIITLLSKIEFQGNSKKEFDTFIKLAKKSIVEKNKAATKIQNETEDVTEQGLKDFFETALKAAYYNFIRTLYNKSKKNNAKIDAVLLAQFYFIREYCYSGLFRFNNSGDFNVAYGGMSYNNRLLTEKIEYMKSEELVNYLAESELHNNDFEAFLNEIEITENDFIFVDPPYDSEFSEYNRHPFTKEDQTRLADTLAKTKGKVMVVIKNTDFIFNLYSERGFNIASFDKKYSVNIKSNNDRKVTHLVITNY